MRLRPAGVAALCRTPPLLLLNAECLPGIGFFVVTSAAMSAADAERCESKKPVAAGGYAKCRESRAAKSGDVPDFTKCSLELRREIEKAEDLHRIDCPVGGAPGRLFRGELGRLLRTSSNTGLHDDGQSSSPRVPA